MDLSYSDISVSITSTDISIYMILDPVSIAVCQLTRMYTDYDLGLDLSKPWYYFSRLNVPPKHRNKGFGSKLLEALTKELDTHKYNVLLEINPYGDLNLEQLKALYMKHGFVSLNEDLLVRYSR